MSDVFAPPVEHWNRVSTSLRTVQRIVTVGPLVAVGAVAAVLLQVLLGWVWLTTLVAVVTLGLAVWVWLWAARHQASWGYAENEDDLFVTGGVAWRRLVAVPYGRMQFVDVKAGPIERAFGIATVTLHTASSGTTATIPGLPAEEANRLRNRLTELGESRGAGL
ncbi:PH domain-containing protein [Solicola sp. PLA-1-18]|uniref:PH domain-containing protein n=1 Tax=Solicola sp. PLA-1-18 TaxID=3380532 RepID=UPI003B802A60